jgi:hypothetical protein
MSFTLLLNSSNVVGSNNNTYQYNFISGSFHAKDCEMAVGSLAIPYSWYNITTAYNNKTISITFPYLATTTTLNITIPDGFYSVSDINNYIELQCINNGLYLINATGSYVYYFQVYSNATYYTNTVVLSLVPTTLPTGYTQPGTGFWSTVSGNGLPSTTSTPSFTLASSGSINKIIGFATGTYASSTSSSQSINGTITPVGSTVNALVMRCNLLTNNIAMPSDILDTVPITSTTFGSNLTYNPSFEKWIDIRDGGYNSMTITFQDQNFNTLYANDPNISMSLLIRQKRNDKK